jgi:16S rRNA (guanine966-N2)-methyltransferase
MDHRMRGGHSEPPLQAGNLIVIHKNPFFALVAESFYHRIGGSFVRIIGGIYKGRTLRAAKGLETRPTSDRLRETLFNILARQVEASRFLDICAGSGAVGIEALSRGASAATFIERSRRACAVIEANLSALGIKDEATIINAEAVAGLRRIGGQHSGFDIVFFDPPYASQVYEDVMSRLASGNLLSADGIVVVEHRAKSPLKSDYGKLRVVRELIQGDSALAFYQLLAGG